MAYGTRADFVTFGLSTAALRSIPDADQDSHLQSASDEADTWLEFLGGYTTPLSAWGTDFRRYICERAAYTITLQARGYNPDGSIGELKTRSEAALKAIKVMALAQSSHLVDGP